MISEWETATIEQNEIAANKKRVCVNGLQVDENDGHQRESRKIFAKNKKYKVSDTEKHQEKSQFACVRDRIASTRKKQRLTTKNTARRSATKA